MTRWRSTLTLCLMLVAACDRSAPPITPASAWDDAAIAQSKAAGDALIALLEEHKTANGHYPSDLSIVDPSHRHRPMAGAKRWTYRVNPDRQSYSLSVEDADAAHPLPSLYRNTTGWVLDQ